MLTKASRTDSVPFATLQNFYGSTIGLEDWIAINEHQSSERYYPASSKSNAIIKRQQSKRYHPASSKSNAITERQQLERYHLASTIAINKQLNTIARVSTFHHFIIKTRLPRIIRYDQKKNQEERCRSVRNMWQEDKETCGCM